MDFLFAFKKFVSRFLFPAPLIFYPLVAGLLLIWLGKTPRKQKAGKICLLVSGVLFWMFTAGPVPEILLHSLEDDFPPFDSATALPAGQSPKFIVVLAGDFSFDPKVPITTGVGPRTAARMAEGVRIHRLYPGSKLVFTGGRLSGNEPRSMAEMMAELAALWGIPKDDIVLENLARDTKDHVKYLKDVLGPEPFVLATTASHMPRAMALFRRGGLHPIAAPVTFQTGGNPWGLSWDWIIPRAGRLEKAEGAFYEYMGLMWSKLRGEI